MKDLFIDLIKGLLMGVFFTFLFIAIAVLGGLLSCLIKSKKTTAKTYDAGDIVDITELAVNDVKWLNMGISHLKAEFYKAKDLIQEQYKVHDCYFDKLAEFFDMYQYLADDRLGEQERIAEKYKDEYAAVKEGQA